MTRHSAEEALDTIRDRGAVRSRDLEKRGISRQHLVALMKRGLVERVARGVYVATDTEYTQDHALAEASSRIPQGVVCLISALHYHGLTTQLPWEVWLGIDAKARSPREPGLPIRVVRYSGTTLALGVEYHEVEGVRVAMFDPAKTVVDCFKYRNLVGLEVALEALRDCWAAKKCSMDEIWRYAAASRMTNVMRPYLESLL